MDTLYGRRRRLWRSRTVKLMVGLFALISLFDVLRIQHNIAAGERTREELDGRDATDEPKLARRQKERIYIASMHYTDGQLLRDHWIGAIFNLTEALGPDNVFLSVYESGSWDDTKDLLRWLDEQLGYRGVPRRFEISNATHDDELASEDKGVGWVDTAEGRQPRRIPFLARLRNQTLRDLIELSKQGIVFDKVLFLNDVVFKVEDVFTLLDTNEGDYAAACSLDFSDPPQYYDTFALRDAEGDAHVMQTWPYFKASASRNAMVNNYDAVPVKSCWNGIVAMPAEPFISSTKLRFRGIPDSLAEYHLEGSECCLIHADNPLTKTRGVFLNPRVRVGYNIPAYEATHPSAGSWVSSWGVFRGLWSNRIKRWTTWTTERWLVRSRISKWEKESGGNREPGEFCVINEMQVLVTNGWAHV